MTPRRWVGLARRAVRARRTVFGVLAVAIGIAWLTAGSTFDIVIAVCWILLGVTQLRPPRKKRPPDPPAANRRRTQTRP